MGDAPADSDELEPDDDRPRVVRFVVGGHALLVPVESVIEVLVPGPVTRLPGAAGAIVGVTSVRGRIVAVVDPSAALGAPAPSSRGRFLVVATAGGPVALVVDRVDAVVPADPEPAPHPASDPLVTDPAAIAPLVLTTAMVDGRPLPVVDAAALVRAAIGPDAAVDAVADRDAEPAPAAAGSGPS